jgi:hypothetical protein
VKTKAPKKLPCPSCPYRKDVPSGLWAVEEYDKLPGYDNKLMIYQPIAAFYCHLSDGRLCSGWVGCHDMYESLGLRLALGHDHISEADYVEALNYESPVELFESGAAAAAHGKRDIPTPSPAARRAVEKLTARLERQEKTDA